MRITSVLLSFFVSFNLFSLDLSGENITLDYTRPSGVLQATSFSVKHEDIDFSGDNVEAFLELKDDHVLLSVDSLSFKLGGTYLDKLASYQQASGIIESIESNSKLSFIQAPTITFSDDEPTTITNISLECASYEPKDQIDQCIEAGILRVSDVEGFYSDIWTDILNIDIDMQSNVKNLFVQINEGSYVITLKISGFKVTVKGTMTHNNGVIDIYVRSARSGILSVKSKLLKEVEKLESENLKVEGDHIFVTL